MKLYTKPGACSTADHIALQWTGQPFDAQVMDAASLTSPEFRAISPDGKVPALVDGEFTLLQNAAILGYIADTHPDARLAGDGSPRQRAEATRWLSFVNSDLHPAFVPLFAPQAFSADRDDRDALAEAARRRVRSLYESADAQLVGKEWIAGFRSFADPYLYVTLLWAGRLGIDLSDLANLTAFKQRMDVDPGVQAALEAEGLA